MASPSRIELLQVLASRLQGDATLAGLVDGRIYNHIPQDSQLPCIRFRIEAMNEWDTKSSTGLDCSVVVDVWSGHRGDKESLTIIDRVMDLMNLSTFTLTNGQSLYIRHEGTTAFTESDGLTHHSAIRFKHIATT